MHVSGKHYWSGGRLRIKAALNFPFILLFCGLLFASFDIDCPAASVVEYTFPNGNTKPQTMVYGADSNYWVAGFGSDQIIRINPTNSTARGYSLPTSPSQPFGLVSIGTNLWFTESYANKIGRLYTNAVVGGGQDHTFVEYPIHATNNSTIPCGPAGLTVGPNTNFLWFVEAQTNKIGSFCLTNHAIVEYSVPFLQNNRQYYNIVVGPDGNLWYTDSGAGKICVFSTNSSGPNGTVAVFALATNSQPFDIIVGPDNAIWFSEFNLSKIGRLTTNWLATATFSTNLSYANNSFYTNYTNSGIFSEIKVPTNNNNSVSLTNAEPYGMTVVTNGTNVNIWFAEQAGCGIDEIILTNGTNYVLGPRFATPTAGSGPQFLVSGADTNIWFGETFLNAFARLVLDHSLLITATNITFTGTNFSGVLATLMDDPTNGYPSNYTAYVTWGDGSSTNFFATNSSSLTNAALNISTNKTAGGFFVNGSHKYTNYGVYNVSLSVTNIGTNYSTGGATTSATFQITVAPPSVTLTVTNIPWIGTNFSGILGSFIETPTNGPPANYISSVTWGDSTAGLNTISTNKNGGGFYLSASHSYSAYGTYPVNLAVSNTTDHLSGTASFQLTTMPGPSLAVVPSGTNHVVLSWAFANTNAAVLQMTTNLPTTNWINVTNVPFPSPGYQFTVTNNISGSRAFYRLKVQ